MINVSVIVCIQNPRADYLGRVLTALRNQSLPKSQWELLLVGSVSKEPLADAWNISWHPNARHIFEDEINLACARELGIREAAADLLIFMNDDNILDPTYLSEAIRISHEWPRLGVWGSGVTRLEFEVYLPEHLREFASILGLRDIEAPRWSNVFKCVEATPSSAGLCVRANVAAAYRPLSRQSLFHISSRTESSLEGAGGDEISYIACSLGLGIGIFPELKQIQLVPKEQTTKSYFLARSEHYNFSRCLLTYKWQRAIPTHPFSPQGFLSILKEFLFCHGFQRRMYLAELRAQLKARRIIAADPPNI